MNNESTSKTHKILTIVGIVLCCILTPMLIINCTLIIKSFVNKQEVPDFGGVLPLIVLTDSMYPEIKSGDIIICRTTEAETIVEGDVIAFFDPAGNGTTVVTHKVIEVLGQGESLKFRTQGINNNTPDKDPVPADMLVGKYTGVRFAGAGSVALFMQTTAGLVVCVFVPLILLVGYDIIRRRMYDKNKNDDMAALMAELEALKAAKAVGTTPQNAADAPAETTDDDAPNEDA